MNKMYGPYLGEFGWEVRAWAPHVNEMMTEETTSDDGGFMDSDGREFGRIYIASRPGHEALYRPAIDAGATFVAVEAADIDGEWMGTVQDYEGERVSGIRQDLAARFDIQMMDVPPAGAGRAEEFAARARPFDYGVGVFSKRSEQIGAPVIGIFARDRQRVGQHRNYRRWDHVVDLLTQNIPGVEINSLGTSSGNRVLKGTKNRLRHDSAWEVLGDMHVCDLVIGESSGSMHLAATSGVPFITFGEERVRGRYQEDNWRGVPHCWVEGGLDPMPKRIAARAQKLLEILSGSGDKAILEPLTAKKHGGDDRISESSEA